MAKEQTPGESAGDANKGEKPGDEKLLAKIESTKLTERETFRQFMVAVAGRDDANYKTAEKIADDADALMAQYAKRAAKYKG